MDWFLKSQCQRRNLEYLGVSLSELRAANAISTVNSSVNVTVQHPVPTELQVTMATEKSSRPSCVPQNATIPDNVTTLLVFANETARFVASVSRGYNVTFDWSFGDGDAVTDEPFLEGCEERECRSSETVRLTMIVYLTFIEKSLHCPREYLSCM